MRAQDGRRDQTVFENVVINYFRSDSFKACQCIHMLSEIQLLVIFNTSVRLVERCFRSRAVDSNLGMECSTTRENSEDCGRPFQEESGFDSTEAAVG